MRNYKKILTISLVIIAFLISGCAKKVTTPSHQSPDKITIKGNTFTGKHKGKGTSRDPDYHYSIYFGKDHKFIQDIISSNGYSARFTEKGTYRLDKKGNIIIQITNVTEEQFANDDELNDGSSPISIVERVDSTLNPAEKKPIKILKKKHYLQGTVNQVRLYQSKKKIVNYNQHLSSEKKKYSTSYGRFSGHTFTTETLDLPMNTIAFKSNKFIWYYGYQDEFPDRVAVFEGTYTTSGNILNLQISKQSKAYYGYLRDIYTKSEYKSTGKELMGSTFKLQLKHSTLSTLDSSFKSWGMKDVSPNNPSNSSPTYDEMVHDIGVDVIASKMHLKKAPTVTDIFPNVNDFVDWFLQEELGDDFDDQQVKILDTSSNIDTTIYHIDGPENTSRKHMVYVFGYTLGEDIGSMSYVAAIDAQGNIYHGNKLYEADTDYTQRYQNYVETHEN